MKFYGLIINILLLTGMVMKAAEKNIYCVVLAGGNGERLWPLSRQSKPKQLLNVASEKTLLEQALCRVQEIISQERILVSTTQKHADAIQKEVEHRIGSLIIEPGSRNTGPAILLACMELYEKDPDAIVLFFPADAFIPEHENHKVHAFLEHVIDFVSHTDRMTLLGVRPTYPATGYGYIEYKDGNAAPYEVAQFHEKPSADVAQRYLEQGNMLWNIGIFCGKVSVFIEEFKQHAPQMYQEIMEYRAGERSYESVTADSIDYAIMEQSRRVSVLPVDFVWCDVGNIEIFLSLKQGECATQDNLIEVQARNNIVDVPHKVVGIIGVDDLCVVEVDDALLIAKRDQTEQVRAVVKLLKEQKKTEYL